MVVHSTVPNKVSSVNCTLLAAELWLFTVPMYDARDASFDFTHQLASVREQLPLFEGELPVRSLVCVLYSANSYKRKEGQDFAGERQLSLNLQAIIVLATRNAMDSD